jgi:hypothetical protein
MAQLCVAIRQCRTRRYSRLTGDLTVSQEVAHLCRLARSTKVVSYLRYYRRAGRTAAIAVVDPLPTFTNRNFCSANRPLTHCSYSNSVI